MNHPILQKAPILGITALLAAGVACQPSGADSPGADSPEFATQVSAVAPAGSDAALVSHNIPPIMAPGERLNVRVSMQNTGTPNWDNQDWVLYRLNSLWSWVFDRVNPPVNAGGLENFDFVITAPLAVGGTTFAAQMRSLLPGFAGYFGSPVNVPVTVDAGATPRWSCSQVSHDVPPNVGPGTVRDVEIRVRNSGTGTWPASGLCLYTRDNPTGLWGAASTCTALTQSVAPGAETTFVVRITAPAATGMYNIRRQILDSNPVSPAGGVGLFSGTINCVDIPVNVTNVGLPYDSAITSQNFPATMAPNEGRMVSITFRNDGTAAWPADGSVLFRSLNSPTSLWGVTVATPAAPVPPGGSVTFSLNIRSPATPGNYVHRWRMYAAAVGFFGAELNVPVVVSNATPPAFDATVVSQTIPASIVAGSRVQFRVTMQNTGQNPWNTQQFGLKSVNTPYNLWNTVLTTLTMGETIAPGAQREFVFDVVAPNQVGMFTSAWRVAEHGGIDFFGATATAMVNVTQPANCGDGIWNPGEACDDGNSIGTDGCTVSCSISPRTVDLLTSVPDRTLWGTIDRKALGNVVIGDVTGDGTPEIIVAEYAHVYPTYNLNGKAQAGRVYGYSGAGFANSTVTQVGGAANFQVWGQDPNDLLGGGFGSTVVVGDVTGDGVRDLIVSAPGADGVGNLRSAAGEIYVVVGQAGLATAGVIDLGTATATTSGLVGARIIGPIVDGLASALVVADFTGDGIADIAVGVPGDDTNGLNSGAVMIVPGAANLASPITIDLANMGTSVATILGAGAGDLLGYRGAAGDISGDNAADLILGAPTHDRPGRTNTGAVYAFFGPVAGTFDLAAGAATATWYGAGAEDRYGYSMSVGNLRGSNAGDLVIGAPQARSLMTQIGVIDLWQGPLAPGLRDLGTGASATTRALGAEQYDNAGSNVAVGDMNGDGFAELIAVSSLGDGPANNRDRAGELVVVLGGSLGAFVNLVSGSHPLRVFGAEASDLMGYHPNNIAVGDIDQDNRADFCIGSYLGADILGPRLSPGRVDCFLSRW